MERARIARIAARLHAILAALGGALILAVVAALVAAFGSRGIFEPKFFTFIIAPGLAGIVLAPFIWLGHRWAMFAALAIALMLNFLFSRETWQLRLLLPGVPALFAIFIGIQFWADKRG